MAISSGKYAKFISDRSGQEFPYSEMVIEWNGSRVHISEFEKKHPQLEPKPHAADPQGLLNARPARTEPAVARVLTLNPFKITSGSTTVTVFEENHTPALAVKGLEFRGDAGAFQALGDLKNLANLCR